MRSVGSGDFPILHPAPGFVVLRLGLRRRPLTLPLLPALFPLRAQRLRLLLLFRREHVVDLRVHARPEDGRVGFDLGQFRAAGTDGGFIHRHGHHRLGLRAMRVPEPLADRLLFGLVQLHDAPDLLSLFVREAKLSKAGKPAVHPSCCPPPNPRGWADTPVPSPTMSPSPATTAAIFSLFMLFIFFSIETVLAALASASFCFIGRIACGTAVTQMLKIHGRQEESSPLSDRESRFCRGLTDNAACVHEPAP